MAQPKIAAAPAAKPISNPLKKLRRGDIERLRVTAQEGGDIQTAVADMVREYAAGRREYQRKWRAANPDKVRAQGKRYRKKHRAELNAK
ncbi:MAG TPA: hypothetical protein PKC22_16325, partial [Rhodocyclaceae bacterium]|nr:hypothetical protein [Rhodocyclaceae bacterium]